MVVCQLEPCNASTLKCVIAAIRHRPRGTYLLVAGDFNTVLDFSGGNKRDDSIAAAMGWNVWST